MWVPLDVAMLLGYSPMFTSWEYKSLGDSNSHRKARVDSKEYRDFSLNSNNLKWIIVLK